MAKTFDIQKPEAPRLEDIALPDTDAYNVKDSIRPDATKPGAIDLPLPGAGAPSLNTGEARQNAIANWKESSLVQSQNPLMKTKTQEFGAGMDHHQFERYYNMPRVYNKLGFSPFRDNEAAYNAESNIFDELGRASGQWANLAGIGAMDAMGFGSITDTETAKKFERATAIGSSSKEGIGAFTTNLYLNSGYSMGIMAEVVAEEVALGLITGASMGAASEVTIPTMVARGMRAGNKLYEGYRASKNVIRTLDALKDINKAKKYFNQTLKNGGKFLNPLENTVDWIQGIDHATDAAGNPLGKLAKTTLGFAGFYKDVRNIRYAWGESGLEGGMVKNEMEENLLDEHYAKFDRPPNRAEANAIKETALKAGATAGWQNVGAIYFSNKIVLDGLLRSYTPLKRINANAGRGGMHKLFQTKKLKGEIFEAVEDNWKQTLKEFKDPAKAAGIGLTYFADNIAEGLQETAQEVISGAAKDYYTEQWRGNTVKGGYYASITDNLQKQTTPEGLEVFMSGFLMGGMMGGMSTTLGSFVPGSEQQSYFKSKWSQFKDPATYEKKKADSEAAVNETANMMNELWDSYGEKLAPDLDNLVAQEKYTRGMNEAQEDGRAKEYYDLKDAAASEHVITALQLGRFDTFVDRLQELKNISPEDVKETYNATKEEYDAAVDKSIANAKRIEARYEMAQEEFKNPFDPTRVAKGGDAEAFQAELQNFNGWEDAQRKFVFLQNSFDRSLERFSSIMGEAQTDAQLSKVPTTDFTTLFHIQTMTDEINRLNIEIKSLAEGTTSESKKTLKKKSRKRDLLEDFSNKMEFVVVQPTIKDSDTTLDKKNKETKAALSKAKTAYKRYLKFLAEANGDHAFNNAIDNSFDKLVDAYMLNGDSNKLNEAINMMIDPGNFTRQAAQDAELRRLRKENQDKEIRDSLNAYKKAVDGNLLLEGIYDLGMFFDHTQFEELIKGGIIPETFKLYKIGEATGEGTNMVEKNSEDYTAAMNVIMKFVPNIMGIPLSKTQMARATDAYDTEAKGKSAEDKRTYTDLAEQYGFDKTAKQSIVPLKEVLESIIASPYASDEEILLAKQLAKRSSARELVTFVNNADNPGTYNPTTQTVIDARYSDSNHEGANLPIEFVILHTEIQRRTTEELKNDATFVTDIGAIRTAAATHFTENNEEGTEVLYGLSSDEQFIAEAMTNPKFQEMLASVPYASTGKSTWGGFVDSVIKMLKNYFGKKVKAGTALNEALHIITTKIDQTYGIKDKKVVKTKPGKIKPRTKTTRTEGNTKLTNAIDMPTLHKEQPALAAQILALYESNQSDPNFKHKDPDFADKKGEAAYKSVQFLNFYNSPSESIQELIDAENEKQNRTVEPLLKARTRTDVGEAIRGRLREKGYTKEERDELVKNVTLAVEIANDPRDKIQYEADELAAAKADSAMDNDKRIELMTNIDRLIDESNTYDEVENAKSAIFLMLDSAAYSIPNSPDGWTILLPEAEKTGAASIGPLIENLIEQRKKAIAFTARIEDIVPGSTIILKSGAHMIVDEVAADKTILAHTAKSPQNITEFTLNQVKFTSAAAQAEVDPVGDQISAADNAQQADIDATVDTIDDSLTDDADSEEDNEDYEIC